MSLNWFESEAGDGSFDAELNGITATISLKEGSKKVWKWMVLPTGERSETPEVWAMGESINRLMAQIDAEKSMKLADESYGRPFENA